MADLELDLADLYARHRRGFFTLALSITGCAARAEDAVHDAFERLSRGPRRVQRDARAYAFAAVRSAAIDKLRRDKRPFPTGANSIFADGDSNPASQAIGAEQRRCVAAAVESLGAEERQVVVMRIYAGLTFAQIAEVTGEPLQTIASRYRRSLEKLRQSMEKLV